MHLKPRRVYWESSVFLSLFQKGDDAVKKFQREQTILLLEQARSGETLILTSTLSIAEARRGEGEPPLSGEEHATLRAFFKQNYIEVVPVDRGIAELAADLGEQFNLRGADAIHLATAVRLNATVFLSWDRHFHRNGVRRNAPIAIEEPRWVGARQLELRVTDDEE